jgi:hypothetical protein
LPARIRIRSLSQDQLPQSETISFAKGWVEPRLSQEELGEIAKRMCEDYVHVD